MSVEIETPPPTFETMPGWGPDAELALLTEMLAIYTPSGQERRLSELLAARLRPLGFATEVDAVGNCIATLGPTRSSQEGERAPIVLLGHIDTVAGEIPVRRAGDRLYGRGAVDAKGPFAAFLAAAARLAARGVERARPLVIVGAVEEEAATSRGARAILTRWRPAYTVIGEPSGADGITLGYKGRLLVELRIEQPVAHTARPEESVAARGAALWQALCDAASARNAGAGVDEPAGFAALTPSLRSIQSGGDGFTEWVELVVGYRLPPHVDPQALASEVEALALAAGATAQARGAEPAYLAPRTGPLAAAFVRAIRAEGGAPAFKRKTGTSDMNVVGPVWNCPILAYGPGDSALDHTPNEHLSLAEFARGVAVLERALGDLLAAPASASGAGATGGAV